jgi:hypothetical protein
MKTLANCSDVEFLRQTNKIRKYVEKWVKDTGIMDIRNRKQPETSGLDGDTKKEVYRAEAKQRLDDILDAALDTHAEETAGLLRLLCFMEPDDTESVKMPQLLGAASDMMNNQETLDFFTSLWRLGLMNTQTP